MTRQTRNGKESMGLYGIFALLVVVSVDIYHKLGSNTEGLAIALLLWIGVIAVFMIGRIR